MSRKSITLLGLALLGMIGGCHGMGETVRERDHRINTVMAHDRAALIDDWDMIMMQDRPTRLTDIHQR